MTLGVDLTSSLPHIDAEIRTERATWLELRRTGRLRLAEITRARLDTLLDIRNTLSREHGQ